MSDIFKQIIQLAVNSRKILITSHMDPDGDSIGSQLALKDWLESLSAESKILNQGKISSKYLFLDDKKTIESIDEFSEKGYAADLAFVLECPNLERTGKIKKLITDKCKIVNLDHHPDNSSFGYVNYVDTHAGALGEIIYELLSFAGFQLTKNAATRLYAAIITDTGRFSFSNTTFRSLKICSELINYGADPKEINHQIYYNNSESALKLLGFTLQNIKTYNEGKIACMIIKQEDLENFKISTGETEGLVDYSLYLRGAEVGVLFTQKNDSLTKVSLRSQNSFDVSSLARIFGGGGHRNAAGCTIYQDLNSTRDLILQKIEEQFKL